MPYTSRHPFTKLKYFFITVIIVNKFAPKFHDGEKLYKNSKHSAYLSNRTHRSYSSLETERTGKYAIPNDGYIPEQSNASS